MKNLYSPTVFMYHEIGPSSGKGCTPVDLFKRQIEYIQRKNWDILTLSGYFSFLKGERTFRRPAVLLTFDDGYESLYTTVLPLSRSIGFPFTVFMSMSYIGQDNSWNTRAHYRSRHLSGPQIREMAAAGVDFGSHGMTHRCLRQLSVEERKTELAESQARLQELTGRDARAYAYPYGEYTRPMWDEVAQYYDCAFGGSAECRRDKSVFAVPRLDAKFLLTNFDLRAVCALRSWPREMFLRLKGW